MKAEGENFPFVAKVAQREKERRRQIANKYILSLALSYLIAINNKAIMLSEKVVKGITYAFEIILLTLLLLL